MIKINLNGKYFLVFNFIVRQAELTLSDHEYVDVLQDGRRQKVFSTVRESGKRSTRSVTNPIDRFVGGNNTGDSGK